MIIDLPYHNIFIKLNLERFPNFEIIEPQEPRDLDVEEQNNIVYDALLNPFGTDSFETYISKNFNSKSKVLLISPDITRLSGTHIYMPIIVRKLIDAGINKDLITILFANGSHQLQTEDEMKEVLGNTFEHISIQQHDYEDEETLSFIGKTSYDTEVYINKLALSSDLIIPTGCITYHYFAGFGGGAKSIIPGIAGRKTILNNHFLTLKGFLGMLHPKCSYGTIRGNPVQEDIKESIKLLDKPVFLFNTVLDYKNQICRAVAGEMNEAHQKGTEYVRELWDYPISKKSNLLIMSAGGFPKDINLVQLHKSIHNGHFVLHEGGYMIVLAGCSQGIGTKIFKKWFEIKDEKKLYSKMLSEYNLNAQTALSMLQKIKKFRIILVSKLDRELVESFGLLYAENLEDAIGLVPQDIKKGLVYFMPKAAVTIPVLR